jgi:MFS family permease
MAKPSEIMDRKLQWHEYITINIHYLGISTVTGSVTPLLLPFLVALLVTPDRKNTDLATIRVVSLAVAMAAQPLAGLLSDRSTLRWGRRRPYIAAGTLLSTIFLLLVGIAPGLAADTASGESAAPGSASNAYMVLLLGIVLWQAASNLSQGALQGLIPDLVPEGQRGRASGAKAVLELLPILPIMFIGRLIDAGQIWLILGFILALQFVTMLITVILVHEEPLRQKPAEPAGPLALRLVALTAVFVTVTEAAVWIADMVGALMSGQPDTSALRLWVAGLAGLAGMTGAILGGVYLGARVGIGPEARQHPSFIWWVIARLLFLAAVGSIQGFLLFYLVDVHGVAEAGGTMARLLLVLAVFLIPAAVGGGFLADRLGRKWLVALSGLVAAAGAFLLVLAPGMPLVVVSGCIVGTATGIFMATHWALGTDLAPPEEAGRYLGIANLAGAGAGIIGVGIGGPMADSFNAIQPGLGYLVLFAVYGVLFILSSLALTRVRETRYNA